MERLLLLLFAFGCGSSDPAGPAPKSAAEKARDARVAALDELDKEQPHIPYVVDQTHVYALGRDCGQGPFRVEGKTLGAEHGERVEVYACAAQRGLQGHAHLTIDGRSDAAKSFGYLNGTSDRCVATVTDLARTGDAGTTAAAKPGAPSGVTAHTPTATADGEALTERKEIVIADGKECPDGSDYVDIASHSTVTATGRALDPNRPFSVAIWSDAPSDLRGVVFVVRQWRVASMKDAEWSDLLQRESAWWAKLEAFEKSNDDLFLHDDAGVSAPPPPARAETQPPKPSVHAAWVPGYYKKSGGNWLWSPGFWRVPDEDVEQELTTTAPVAPPPARDESTARASAPAPDAVWTEGSWQWDGARWVWVQGAWRLPPAPLVVWQQPRWAPRGARFVLVPGGWSRRR
ncbi:MAG TPA: YXWGXW repeat-containing protein [Polyangiaceae bacterium]|jgi:hypothetical protein